jgi:hypothetical protein
VLTLILRKTLATEFYEQQKNCNKMNLKRSTYILLAALSIIWFFMPGCSKQASLHPVASLNVINALPASAPLILVQGSIAPAIGEFGSIGALSYASTAVLTAPSGSESFYVVQDNVDTMSINAQGGDFMFSGTLNFTAGGLYSLFITGADTSNPDYLLVQDTPPAQTDSTVGIRFVNLSTGSNPVSVDIQGQPNGSTVSSLAYKNITSFANFAATSSVSSYIFEFRDATSGNLLASYTLSGVNSVLFKNLTIALIGQPAGGTVAQSCIRVNSF